MTARTAHRSRRPPQKPQRELEDLQLVIKARNGSQVALDALHAPLPGVRAAQGELVLPRRRRRGRPDPGGDDRPLQGGARLPLRQGDVVPQLRRALRDPADHHGDQDGHPLQARAAQHLRLVQPHAGRPGHGGRVHARRRAPGPGVDDPSVVRRLDGGAAEPRLLRSAAGSRQLESEALRLYLDGHSYEQWPRGSGATRRRSTTRSSG